MTDLELALLHLQDDIEIPEITLTIHPTVKQLIAKVGQSYLLTVAVNGAD